MQKGIFVVHLFILQKVLTMVNILSNQLQSKTATLGNAANVIKSVIKSFEDLRNPVAFSQMWKEILQFCEDHNLTIEKPFQSCKRKRLQPKSLSSFVMSTTTSAQYNTPEELEESKEDYFRCHAYFPILDCIIENMNKRFTPESLEMATSIDNFFKLDFALST
ncbi:uncharacterized protein LOC111038270 [Myzus persicae]|nr:uncharacterized protein LOC111038270 [Myzus persicae]